MLRTARNFDRPRGVINVEPSRTVQSQRDEADINVLVHRFGITGQMPANARVPIEGDFNDVFDFQSAHNAVRRSVESFDMLPAKVRNRFDNNPGKFYSFCTAREDGKLANFDEMVKLGIAKKPVPVVPSPPQRVVVVNEGSGDGKDGVGKAV